MRALSSHSRFTARGPLWLALGALALACSDPQNFFPSVAESGGSGGAGGTGGKAGSSGAAGRGSNVGGKAGGGSGGSDGSGGANGGSAGTGEATGGTAGSPEGGTSGSGGDQGGSTSSGGTSAEGGSGDEAGAAGEPVAGTAGAGGTAGVSGASGASTNGGTAGTSGVSGNGGIAGTAGQASGGASGSSGASGISGASGSSGTGGTSCIPTTERCDGVDNDCGDGADEGGVCPTGCTARTHAGHVYLLCLYPNENQQVTYTQAANRCTQAGNDDDVDLDLELARVEGAEENAFLKTWIAAAAGQTEGMVWFGANDLDDELTWVFGRGQDAVQFFTANPNGGGTPYMGRFHDFAAGRPNNPTNLDEDCGSFDSEYDWQWNDLDCTRDRLGFVCEEVP